MALKMWNVFFFLISIVIKTKIYPCELQINVEQKAGQRFCFSFLFPLHFDASFNVQQTEKITHLMPLENGVPNFFSRIRSGWTMEHIQWKVPFIFSTTFLQQVLIYFNANISLARRLTKLTHEHDLQFTLYLFPLMGSIMAHTENL